MRHEKERKRGGELERRKIVPTGRDALTWETSCENVFFLLISFVNESVVSRNSWRLHILLMLMGYCCLLFKWNLFAYLSKQFRDENVHRCVVCVIGVWKQPENIQWLQIVLMSRGFEWMIGTVDKHAILFKSLIIIAVAAGLVGVKPFSFHLSSLCDHFLFRKYPNFQIHFAPSHSSLSRCVCTIITVSFRLMSIILSVSSTRNVSTNRTLESRNKSNHLLIENRAYKRQLFEKSERKTWKSCESCTL